MAPNDDNNIITSSRRNDNSIENSLQTALILTEASLDLKDRCVSGEKYLAQVRKILTGAERAFSSLYCITKCTLEQAKQMLMNIDHSTSSMELRQECERLATLVDKHIRELEAQHFESNTEQLDLSQLSEKIKTLEARQKLSDNFIPPRTSSSKNMRDVNEKYPENLSRESLIDLNTVVNLPSVPEDIFTGFSNNRPTRSSSLSSLKSMRKIKMYLQRAESSEEDDSSDADEHDFQKMVAGDSDENRSLSPHSPMTKKFLGNIKEESQD